MPVMRKTYTFKKPFITENGDILTKAVMAYEEYGTKGKPVILLNHGGLSDSHFAGKYSDADPLPGVWDDIIGPDKVLDTNTYHIIATNALGSMFGSSGPAAVNPDTGKLYGKSFPQVSLTDMVRFQKQFFEENNISRLFMVAGVSMGALMSMQLAALYPVFMQGAAGFAVSGRITPEAMAIHNFFINAIRLDPEFRNGEYETGKILNAMRLIHQIARIYYVSPQTLKSLCFDPVKEGKNQQLQRNEAVKRYLTEGLEAHLAGRDPNSYLILMNALNGYDLGRDSGTYAEGVLRIKCPVKLVNFDTDLEFGPEWAHEIADILNQRTPRQAAVNIVKTPWGHIGCLKETKAIADILAPFMQRITMFK